MTNQQNHRILDGRLAATNIAVCSDHVPLNDGIGMRNRFIPLLYRRQDRRTCSTWLIRGHLPFARIVRLLEAA